MTIERPHLYMPVQDAEGDVTLDVIVRFLVPGSTSQVTNSIYASALGNTEVVQPFEVDDGIIDVYFDEPVRVRVGCTPPGQNEFFIEDVDILPSGAQIVVAAAGLEITNEPDGLGQILQSLSSDSAQWVDEPVPVGVIHPTSGAPANSLGSIGDYALDVSSGPNPVLYGPKSSAGWPGGMTLATDEGANDRYFTSPTTGANFVRVSDSNGVEWYVGVTTAGTLTTTDTTPE